MFRYLIVCMYCIIVNRLYIFVKLSIVFVILDIPSIKFIAAVNDSIILSKYTTLKFVILLPALIFFIIASKFPTSSASLISLMYSGNFWFAITSFKLL